MFKKKDKAVAEINDPCEKVTKTVVQETVETTGGIQTTRTVITTSNREDIESAFKKFNLGAQNFGTSGTCVTKKIVYSSSGKQAIEETVESFEEQPQLKASEEKKGSGKSGKSLTERMGLKSSKSAAPSKAKQNASSPTSENATTAATKTKGAAVVKTGKFEEDALKSHNAFRAKHGVPPLKLSKEICAYSKEWSDHLAATDTFQHRNERKYGENIFMKWSSDPNHVVEGNEAVESWYSEIKDHVFGKEPTSLKSGHFTQVIWKKSEELGIAWSRSRTGKIIVVANYNPAGNFIGTFSENVPPPKK